MFEKKPQQKEKQTRNKHKHCIYKEEAHWHSRGALHSYMGFYEHNVWADQIVLSLFGYKPIYINQFGL